MAVDPAAIRTRFPGVFDAVSDASLSGAIASAVAQVSVANLGTLSDEATLYLACHVAELGKASRAGGQHHARAGLVEIDFGREGGQTSFLFLYRQLVKRAVFPAGPVGPIGFGWPRG